MIVLIPASSSRSMTEPLFPIYRQAVVCQNTSISQSQRQDRLTCSQIDLQQSRCTRFGPGHSSRRRQRSCRLHNAHNLTTHYPAFIDLLVYITNLTERALPQTTYLSDSLTSVRMQGHRPPDVRATQASLALMIIPYIPCISYICRPLWYN